MTKNRPAYLFQPNRRSWCAMRMIVDGFIIVICFLLAMLLRFESLSFADNFQIWAAQLPVVFITIVAFYWLGLYHWAINISSSKSQLAVVFGSLISAATLFGVSQALTEPVPFGVPIIYAALLLLLSGGSRLLWSHFFVQPSLSNRQPVVIYDAGDAGKRLSDALTRSEEYVPLAFVDGDPSRQGATINNLRVYDPGEMHHVIKTLPITAIVLADPTKSRAVRREIVSRFDSFGLEFKTPFNADECSPSSKHDHSLRLLRPQDLFGQSALPPRAPLMRKNIAGKVILVTGAGGSIGSELCRQIIKYDPAGLVLFDFLEGPLDNIFTELQNMLISVPSRMITFPLGALPCSWQDRF
jgi:FlaA1/EpsC-like NDP-sugar epimerase